jgi:hypothetical protein
MKTVKYCRSEIYSFFDLTDEQQKYFIDHFDSYEYAEESSYVVNPMNPDEFLSLSDFMRFDSKNYFDGYMSDCWFGAYFIKVSKDGSEAVVSYRYS